MIVYKYLEQDLEKIRFNKWARHFLRSGRELRNMKNYLKGVHSYTLFDKEKPVAILAFHEYDRNKYDGCIVADESFGSNPKYAIKMKWLIQQVIKEFDMKRVQTKSEDDEALNRWHEFLGFKLEKKDYKKSNGFDLNLWGMEWE